MDVEVQENQDVLVYVLRTLESDDRRVGDIWFTHQFKKFQ